MQKTKDYKFDVEVSDNQTGEKLHHRICGCKVYDLANDRIKNVEEAEFHILNELQQKVYPNVDYDFVFTPIG